MKKRTNKKYEEGTVGAAIITMLGKYDFDDDGHMPRKTFFIGYDGSLSVRISAYPDHAYVSFTGTGVKKDKNM